MLNTPLISVIIPVYNLEKEIAKTLDSVCAQTYDNLQIIIVNDGSRDGSLNVCREYAQKDERIVLIDKANGGLPMARQSGLSIAKGEYIHHLDGGDYIALDTYQTLVDELNRNNFPDILVFGFYFVNTNRLEKSQAYPQYVNSSIEFLKHIWTTQQYNAVWQYIHKKELADEIIFDSRLNLSEDTYYTSQLVYNAENIKILDVYLLYYVVEGESMTRSPYSEKGVRSLFLVSELIDKFMSDKPCYRALEFELLALKLQSYATIILGGGLDKMDEMVTVFTAAFKKYPQLKKTGVIKRVSKIVILYSKSNFLYRIMLKRYRSKGKIR